MAYWINVGILCFMAAILVFVCCFGFYVRKYNQKLIRNPTISCCAYSYLRPIIDCNCCCVKNVLRTMKTQEFEDEELGNKSNFDEKDEKTESISDVESEKKSNLAEEVIIKSNFDEKAQNILQFPEEFGLVIQSAFLRNFTYVLVNKIDKTLLIVDPSEPERLIEELKRLGYWENYKVDTILITHHHFDHDGGLYAFKNMKNVKIISPKTHPDLRDGGSICENGVTIEVIPSSFHCPHYAFYVTGINGKVLKNKFCFTGDSFFVGGGFGAMWEGSISDVKNFIYALNEKLDDNTFIFGGHEYSKRLIGFSHYVYKCLSHEAEDTDVKNLSGYLKCSENKLNYATKQLRNKKFVSSTWKDEKKYNISVVCTLDRPNNETLKKTNLKHLKSIWKEWKLKLKSKSIEEILSSGEQLEIETPYVSESEEELGNISIKTSDTSTPDAGMKYIKDNYI